MKTQNKMMGMKIDPHGLYCATQVCDCGLIHYQFIYVAVVVEWGTAPNIDEVHMRFEALIDASLRPLC